MYRMLRQWGFALGLVGAAMSAPADNVPVVLTWPDDPQTTVTVFWQAPAPGRGTVRYGLTTNYTHAVSDAGGMRRHRIALRDLQPGARYHYAVASSDGWAVGDRTFPTAPTPTGGLHFVVHGDLQGGRDDDMPDASRGVAEAIAAAGPNVVIHMGDMSNQHDIPGHSTWDDFFASVSNELSRSVFMPAPGNHDQPEFGSAYFWQYFDLPLRPVPGQPYSFTAGPVHFIALDSDVGVAAQTNWLMRDLQAAAYDTNVAWIIPYFHRPPYSWGERGGNDVLKDQWCPLFTMYGADLVFSGHSHNYQRTVPIRGVTYVVAGGGGANLYGSEFTPDSHAYATTCFHFVSMQVTGSVMRYRAIRSDGLVFDDQVFTNARRKVLVEPAFPVRGRPATIRYDATQGPLGYSAPIGLHWGADEFASALADTAMTYNAASGYWEHTLVVPSNAAQRIAFVFHDAAVTNWDNNYLNDWQALLDDMPHAPPGAPSPVLAVRASPAVTGNPETQNNPGDNMDLSTNGGALACRDVSGFGHWGRLYFNHDATNLYAGGSGLDLGGANNVGILFLGLDTLAEDAGTLWAKSGLPQALDDLHNLAFTEPMDLAIVLGSEWGDGPAYSNFTYAGYNFGQGVYYLGAVPTGFAAVTNARLSQFDGTDATPCATGDDDGDERTDRWEAAIPWSALQAAGGATSVTYLLVAGVIGSDSTNGNNRYLSASHLARRAYGTKDEYGNFGYNFVTVEPEKVALEHGDEDNDGLPNAWEQAYFHSVTGAQAHADDDQDAMDHRAEFIAGTRPDDRGSVLRARAGAGAQENELVLHWGSETDRTYDVWEAAAPPPAPFLEKTNGIRATPPANDFTVHVGSASSGWFRVCVRP